MSKTTEIKKLFSKYSNVNFFQEYKTLLNFQIIHANYIIYVNFFL